MLTRREFVHRGALGAGAVVVGGGLLDRVVAFAGPSVPPFTRPLPLPHTAEQSSPGVYTITATQRQQQLHPKLPATTVWTYDDLHGQGGSRPLYPGPTIEVERGQAIEVRWRNRLPAPGDPSVIGPWAVGLPLDDLGQPTLAANATPRILTHVHGLVVIGTSDGNPYATTADYVRGDTYTTTYVIDQPATTLWYHDHVLGATRLNVMAGLAGFFIVRDDYDTGLASGLAFSEGIPERAFDVPLAIQDRQFDKAGQLVYAPAGTWIPEFFGDQILVNGGISPYLNVEPRKYRFRLLNGSNARFYNLEIVDNTSGGPGPQFRQIGAEGGLFASAVPSPQILLLPGERADVVVDFAAFAGKTLLIKNRSLPKGIVSPAKPFISNIMQLRVGTTVTSPGPTTNVTTISGGTNANLPSADVQLRRNIRLEEVLNAGVPVRLEINGKTFEDPVEEQPVVGTTEDWRFINLSADTHPMHMHLVTFQVVSRQAFDVAGYMAALTALPSGEPSPDPTPYLIGPVLPPRPNEVGFKDTVGANPGEVTTIRAKFDVAAGASLPQKFVYHCHIIEHEDNDMMRPFEVVAAP